MIRNKISAAGSPYTAALFAGFASAVIQVVMIREMLSLFRGNEFIIGIIFSAWFLGIFLGARSSSSSEGWYS